LSARRTANVVEERPELAEGAPARPNAGATGSQGPAGPPGPAGLPVPMGLVGPLRSARAPQARNRSPIPDRHCQLSWVHRPLLPQCIQGGTCHLYRPRLSPARPDPGPANRLLGVIPHPHSQHCNRSSLQSGVDCTPGAGAAPLFQVAKRRMAPPCRVSDEAGHLLLSDWCARTLISFQ